MSSQNRFVLNVVCALTLAAGGAAAQPSYSATVIGPLPDFNFVTPTDMAADGMVVGGSSRTRGEYPIEGIFGFAGGDAQPLGPTRQTPTNPLGVNDGGTLIVGHSGFQAVVWINELPQWLSPEVLDPPLFGGFSAAWDANDDGVMVGDIDAGMVLQNQAVYWADAESHAVLLQGIAPEYSPGTANAINNSGQIAGTAKLAIDALEHYAVRWDDVASFPDIIDTLPGSQYSIAYAINDRGDIVGVSQWPDTFRVEGFFWDNDTEDISGIGLLPGHTYEFSEALDINEARQVVGNSNAGEGVAHAVLWENGALYDLNDLVDPIPGVLWLSNATAINDDGVIAAEGVTVEGPHEFDRVIVLLTPRESCPPDCDGNGTLNTLDFLCFLNLFSAGDPGADFNGDGIVNTLDFLAFLNAYSEGCE